MSDLHGVSELHTHSARLRTRFKVHVLASSCLSACNNSRTAERIFMRFDSFFSFSKTYSHILVLNRTNITDTFPEDAYAFLCTHSLHRTCVDNLV
jgi:hypothetical protein